jgi:hypothetical protein
MRVAAFAFVLTACANATTIGQDDASSLVDTGVNEVLTLPLDAAVEAFVDAGCAHDGALGGVGMPTGSIASATTTYAPDTPGLAVDGDLTTYWNAGDVTGSLTIAFPSPQTFDAIRMGVTALPTSDETYAITGFQNGVPIQIGQSTQSAPEGGGILAPIGVTIGTYDSIRIDVTSTASWVAITDVALVTPSCP